MAGVIREKRQLLNKQIGVVGASTAAVDYAESMKRNADQLTNKFVNLANQEAQRKGDELGNSLTDYRTINPTTGEPEALSKMPSGFGTTAAQAFQDSVNTNFEKSITAEIDGMSAKAAMLHPLDADAYADAFSSSVNLMKQHATGRYANLIDRYSTKYLASTKLNIQAKQTVANNNALKADLIASNEIAGNKIRKLNTAKANWADRRSAITTQEDELRAAKDANILTPTEYYDQVSIIRNNATLGSLENFLFKDATQADLPMLTAFVSYLNNSNDDSLLKLDDKIIVVPNQFDEHGVIAVNEMTLREYAIATKRRLSETNNNKVVLDQLTKNIQGMIGQRTQDVITKNILQERMSGVFQSAMREELSPTFSLEYMNLGESESWFSYLDKNKKAINRHIGQTEVGADNTNADVSKEDYAVILKNKYTNIANQSLTYVLNQVDNNADRELKLITIRALSERGMFSENYANLTPETKSKITETEFTFLAKTHESMTQVGDSKAQFKDEFIEQAKKNAVVFGALVTKENSLKKDQLKLAKIAASKKLQETTVTLEKQYLSEGANTDIFGVFEDGAIDGSGITSTINKIQKLFSKELKDATENPQSPHNFKDIMAVKNNLILKYTNGLMANVVGDLDQTFTFGDVTRTLEKSDIQKIKVAIQTGKLNENVPKELHSLFNAVVVDGKGIIPTEALEKSFQDIEVNFTTKTNESNARKKVTKAIYNIKNRVNVVTENEEKVIENSILGPEEGRKEGWPMWALNEPLVLEDGTTNPIWEKTLSLAIQKNRLPKQVVTLLNNAGAGRTKNLAVLGKAIQVYKMLSEMKVPDAYNKLSMDKTVNAVSGDYLVGSNVNEEYMNKIKYAINNADDERATADILAELVTFNDGKVRQNEKDTFFKNIETAYLDDSNLKNRPTSVMQLQNKAFSNTRINQDMADWADNLIATGNAKNEKDFTKLYKEEIERRYASSSIVYSPSGLGGFVDDEGIYRSMHALSKWVPSVEGQIALLQEWGMNLPSNGVWGNEVNASNLEGQTLGDTSGRKNSIPRSVNGVIKASRYEDRDKVPMYLMPVSKDKDNKTYKVITTKKVGDQIEVSYVLDPTDPNNFLEVTIDEATLERLNNKSNMTYDQKLDAMIEEYQSKIETSGFNVERTKELIKKQQVLIKEKVERNSPEIISSNHSATITKNYDNNAVNVSADATAYLQVAEGFTSKLISDNMQIGSKATLKSFGYGMQYASLTSEEKSLIKNKEFITKSEGLAVLKVRVRTVRNTWVKALKGDGMDYNNLPAKTRIAMISFGFQLDMSNVMSTKGIKAWPKFMNSIRNASKHSFNSPKQKEFLLEAKQNMLFNTDRKGKVTSTGWSKQTPERAMVVSEMILG